MDGSNRGSFFIPQTGLIGVAEIDADHREIVEGLERLRLHLDEDAAAAAAGLRALIGRLAEHFRFEEVLMRRLNYPEAEQHARHHEKSLVGIAQLSERMDRNGAADLDGLREVYRVMMDDIFPADLLFHDFLINTNRLK